MQKTKYSDIQQQLEIILLSGRKCQNAETDHSRVMLLRFISVKTRVRALGHMSAGVARHLRRGPVRWFARALEQTSRKRNETTYILDFGRVGW